MLAACILAHDAARCLPNAIASVVGHVDKICVAVDDRTADGTVDWLRLLAPYGSKASPRIGGTDISWWPYTFDDATGFSGAYNALFDRADCDWTFQLDADEVVDPGHARNLRGFCVRGNAEGIDCWGFARRNWWDLEREKYREEWWPDYQFRLMRRHVRNRWRVHPAIVGAVKMERAEPELMTIQHFNLAYRSEADWAGVSAFYDRLMALDLAEGRIP